MSPASPIRPLLLAAGLLSTLLAPAGAQTLYRCGNTFSQTPCGSDASVQRARSDVPADAASGVHGAELCSAATVRALQLDTQSDTVQIDAVTKAPVEVIRYADRPTAAHVYLVSLKVKPYSPFNGPRRFACHLSEDELRVLQFAPRP